MTDDLPEDFVAIKNMGLNAVRVPTSTLEALDS